MLHGVTVRSSIARGRILGIRYGEGIPWSEFTIVTAADIPGKNEIALIEHDQPCLAAEMINHPEEAIVLLAHPDQYLLEEARRAVQIDVEPLPAIFSIEDSIAKRAVIVWRGQRLQVVSPGKRRRGCRVGASGRHRRGRIPDRRAGTALHRKSGHDRDGKSRGRRNGLGLAAVSLLRAQGSRYCCSVSPRKKFA